MERYESKHVQILQPASMIYGVLSDFNHLTPVLGDKVEGWSATTDTCSFKAQGFQINLQMVEKVAPKLIKVTGAEGSPMDFTFWLQAGQRQRYRYPHAHCARCQIAADDEDDGRQKAGRSSRSDC